MAVVVLAGGAVAASAASAAGHWYKNGAKIQEGTRPTIKTSGKVFKITAGSLFNLECSSAAGKGWVENPTGGLAGAGSLEELTFNNCTVPSAPKCKVSSVGSTNGTIKTLPDASTGLRETEEVFQSTLKGPGAAELLMEIEFTGAECALRGVKYKIDGETVAKVNNTTEALEFTAIPQRGGTLHIGNTGVTWVGSEKQELTAGGSLTVGV